MHIDLSALSKALSSFPSEGDGKESILAMKESGYPQWRQMEWIGFFFQFLCENRLPSVGMNIPGHSYGNTTFDGFMCIDWDFRLIQFTIRMARKRINSLQMILKQQ